LDIGVPIRELGAIDHGPLAEAILGQEEAAWHEDTTRQQDYDVHRQTQSIVMVFVNLERWPQVEVLKQPGWDRLAEVAVPVMHDLIQRHYPPGGTIIRAMAAKLLGPRVADRPEAIGRTPQP
jgi:hypothetical protein